MIHEMRVHTIGIGYAECCGLNLFWEWSTDLDHSSGNGHLWILIILPWTELCLDKSLD